MIAALRRLSMASPLRSNPSPSTPTAAAAAAGQRLASLANRLRLYNPPPPPSPSEDDGDDEVVDSRGKVFSPMAVPESAAPALPRPDPFRPKRAAVLVCLFEDPLGNLRVILTKRSSNLSTHSGEVSLPGGKAEEGDADDRETALREAQEEIGLDPSLVSVVTILQPFFSRHLLRVVPVIGILFDKDAFKPTVNTAEVEEIFDAPLEMFLKDENRRSEERQWMEVKFLVHYFDFVTENKKFVIWGLTAGILIHAASVVYQRQPAFPEIRGRFKIPRSLMDGGDRSMP